MDIGEKLVKSRNIHNHTVIQGADNKLGQFLSQDI